MKPTALFEALDFRLSELIKWDFILGLGTAVGAVWLALVHPETLSGVIGVAIAIVGVIIGAVVGGAAILGAFLNQSFLRKLKRVGGEAVPHFAPFLFTAFLGVLAALFLLFLTGLPDSAPVWMLAVLAGAAGLSSGWAIMSVVYDLDVLVQFLRLQEAAADVSDEDGDTGDGAVRHLPRS